MGFINRLKKDFENTFKNKVAFTVIGGQNNLPETKDNSYVMWDKSKEYGDGVIEVDWEGDKFYFLGAMKEEAYRQGGKRTVSGAIVGGMLAGGIGAIVGSQTRKKDKDISTYFLEFADYKTKENFVVQVKPSYKNGMLGIERYKTTNPKEIGIDK